MPLTTAQAEWIEKIGGSAQPEQDEDGQRVMDLEDEDDFVQDLIEEAQAQIAQKKAFVDDNVAPFVKDAEAALKSAFSGLTITNEVDAKGLRRIFQKTVLKSMPVLADGPVAGRAVGRYTLNQDVEADSRADIGAKTVGIQADAVTERRQAEDGDNTTQYKDQIDPNAIKKMHQAIQKVLDAQARMMAERDNDEQRVFSDEDIRKELWGPLVRAGVIPENAVPDAFSEEAIAFNGAAELYNERLAKYSKNATGKEDILHGLGVAKKTAQMAGKMAGSLATMINAQDIAAKTEEIRLLKADPNAASAQTGQFFPDGSPITALDQAFIDQSNLEYPADVANAAGAFLVSSLTLGEMGVKASEKNDYESWVEAANGWLGEATKMVGQASSVWIGALSPNDTGALSPAGIKIVGNARLWNSCITGGLSAVRIVPTAMSIAREPDETKRAQMTGQLVERIGEVVTRGINAYAGTLYAVDDREAAGVFTSWANSAQAEIRVAAKIPSLIAAFKRGDAKEAAAFLVGNALEAGAAKASKELIDLSRRDATATDIAAASFHDAKGMQGDGSSKERKNLEAATGAHDKMHGAFGDLDKVLAGKAASLADPDDPDPEKQRASEAALMAEIEAMMQQSTAREEQARIEAELAKAGQDIDQMRAIMDKVQAEQAAMDALYDKAKPNFDLPNAEPEDLEKAIAAMDEVIARGEELRSRIAIANGLTSGGAGLVAALLPGTGAVAAAQKLVFDVIALAQAADKHNKWIDSMEIAFRANSAYASSILNALNNARVELSKDVVKTVLGLLKASSEVARVFDPTGGATIASSAATLGEALVNYGYDMYDEVAIKRGWDAYRAALDDPGNRKAARKAMKINSTFAKYVIAYGATVAGDASAREAVRMTGLTTEVLSDSVDVCKKLVVYLEKQLSDNQTVLRVGDYGSWQPSVALDLTFSAWSAYRLAAMKKAQPPLDPGTGASPALDRALVDLGKLEKRWSPSKGFGPNVPDAERSVDDITRVREALAAIESLLAAYAPKAVQPPANPPHKAMIEVARTLARTAQTQRTIAAKAADELARRAAQPVEQEEEELIEL